MLIILDRDGVINHDSADYIKSADEWHAIPGSLQAIAKLHAAGHTIVVATNQSGIGRGYYSLATLTEIHEKMHAQVEEAGGKITKIYFCPHVNEDNCNCRKPQPGMLLQIKKDFPELFPEAVLVGDSARDIAAALSAGCKAALVRTGNGPRTIKTLPKSIPIYDDLLDFVNSM